MFLDNKYRYYYYSIIDKAKSRKISTGYTEKHHIIPSSLGGNNKKENLVVLTAREHFVCHWLLTKMVEGKDKSKMWNALSCMMFREDKNQKRYKINSRTFERLRKQISEERKGLYSGDKNGMYGKTHTEEARLKISKTHKGKKLTQEQCDEISQRHKGKKRSDATRQKQIDSWKTRPRIYPQGTCKYCGITARLGNINRWHNENCNKKLKETCKHCGKEASKANIIRWHNDNCKKKIGVECA